MIRLDKFLVEMNKGSRSQIKEAAKKGRIQVNGAAEKKTDRKIDPDADQVMFDGVPVVYRNFEYFMLNKPQGVVSATEDNLHRTVIDLLEGDGRSGLFPVGRLDIDTEGLLILTNDGDLAHRLLSPKKHVDKQYYAKIEGTLPEDCEARMAAGITLTDGTEVMPARLEVLATLPDHRRDGSLPDRADHRPDIPPANRQDTSAAGGADMPQESLTEVLLTIREGKFHQVKRMFEALGCRVVYLKRMSMGALTLDEELLPGQYRRLTGEEIRLLGEKSLEAKE